MGGGTCIGMLLGARKNEEANRIGSTAFFSSIALGLLFTLLGLLFLEPLMRVLGSSNDVLPYAEAYGTWILIGFAVMSTSLVLSTILRCEGKMDLSMAGIATGAVLNMALDPLFIFTLNMGITGAAVATVLSQTISFGILLFFFLSGRSDVKLSLKSWQLSASVYRRILVTGLPSLCRHGVTTFATIALNTAAGMYGGDILIAALAIVNKVITFIQAILKGIFQGAQATFSYNKGAGRYDRVRQAYRYTLTFNTVLIALIGAVMLFAARWVMGIFTAEAGEILTVGAFALTVETCSLLVMPFNFSGNTLLQSVGEPWKSTLLAALPQGVFYIPCLFILPLWLGADGIIWSFTAGQALTVLATLPVVRDYFARIPAGAVPEQKTEA